MNIFRDTSPSLEDYNFQPNIAKHLAALIFFCYWSKAEFENTI